MLTDTTIKNAKAPERPYKLADGRGLSLLVKPSGARLWRFRYRHGGVEKMLSFGAYPDVTLARARAKREDARRLVADGVDPSEVRRAARGAVANTLEALAREWMAQREGSLAPATRKKTRWILEDLVFPAIGRRPIADIKPTDLLRVLRRIESAGHHETAHRVKQKVGQVYRFAVATGRADHDITASLKDALAPVVATHRAAITDPAKVGELLRALDGYQGQPETEAALTLAPLVFLRPGELRGAEWAEIDLAEAEWRIPAQRMKMSERHIVPLSTQAVAILERLHPLTGHGRLVFPSLRSRERPISENTLNAALRRLGYGKNDMTAHGFRTVASTLLNEMSFHSDLIELQLAHKPRDKVRAAYNRAERLAERRDMMQSWADYLDSLKGRTEVTPIRTRAAQ